ncbi:hypothetical protein AAIB41_02450 [Brucella sp. BE17]|uniref:hypothetical protein n=1 Tax=Brucella sp. BE17 TaxID=3142977 RepID=UPI0031BB374A
MSELPFAPTYKENATKTIKKPTLKKVPAPKYVSPTMPTIDMSKVPEDLLFMTTQGFKDAATVFYNDLGHIYPSSDRAWVQKRFVDGLSTWPHIERADETLGGMISTALTIVAKNPHFPTWWRSFGVAMLRGNPLGCTRSLKDIIAYKGAIIAHFDNEMTDQNFNDSQTNDRRDIKIDVVDDSPLDFDVECPLSLPQELWDRIPEEKRRQAIIEMALGMRVGVHPIETVETLFLTSGIRS